MASGAVNAAFVGKMTQSTTHLSIAPLSNHSYKRSFGGLMRRTIHISRQTLEEILLGIISSSNEKSAINTFNYITLFMRYFIHSCKLKITSPSTLLTL